MVRILDIRSRQILDSRGNPTVETEILTSAGWSRAAVPSGASTGKYEAVELRDNKPAYLGQGVRNALKNVKSLKKTLVGTEWTLPALDRHLIKSDGTKNKSKLGANALLSVSMAFAKAQALEAKIPLWQSIQQEHKSHKVSLPVPAMNIINGGKHAGNALSIQEYQILPQRAKSFSEAVKIGSEVYHILKKLLQQDYGKIATNIGDEGGFAPPMTCHTEPFDYILRAVEEAGYVKEVDFGIDAAATEFYANKQYKLEDKPLSAGELLDAYKNLVKTYPLRSIEDPFHENDFAGFANIRKKLPRTQIVGDDLLVTNPTRIKRAIKGKSANCLLLKVNQIGTITESLTAARLAQTAKWGIQVSHRSGETSDTFIADLAVGINAGQIKSGAPARGERVAKYNQLMRIEEELGRGARYGR